MTNKPTEEEAKEAVKTLIRWAGDDPTRPGLLETPNRVTKSYREIFSGYDIDPEQVFKDACFESNNYDEMITLLNIRAQSFCEHHMLPVIGKAHVAYIPNEKILGISKIARVVDIFSKRLQIQERLAMQIAQLIDNVLQPNGVAVILEAYHQCMTIRGVQKNNTTMQTIYMTGVFRDNPSIKADFLNLINLSLKKE